MNEEVSNSGIGSVGELFQLFWTKLPLWGIALIVAVITFMIARVVRYKVEHKLAEHGLEEDHKEVQILGGRMSYIIVLTLGLTGALNIAGIDLTSVIAAGALGIGFALKDLIMNFIAGIMILLSRHFVIGDYIKVDDIIGRVVEIQSRVTILQDINGTKVIVPNADLFTNKVISLTGNPFRRIDVVVGVDYRTDLENVVRILMSTAANTKGVLAEPKTAVLVEDFGESAVILKVRAWVNSTGGWIQIRSNLRYNIRQAFNKYGINIPFPIRTIENRNEVPYEEKKINLVEPNIN